MENLARHPARHIIAAQIALLDEIIAEAKRQPPGDELARYRERLSRWKDRTVALLQEKVSDVEATRLKETRKTSWQMGNFIGNLKSEAELFKGFLQALDDDIERHPDQFPRTPVSPKPVTSPPRIEANTGRVFVVHGHDGEARLDVARFIEKLGLTPIVLHEQPNEGQTIIEKFERNADVSFAVVLLTPDDRGASNAAPDDTKMRARQNVVLELGYFLGRLGRRHVAALVRGDVELPSDYHGVLYIPMEASGAWRLGLAKEMKQAGLKVDLNLAL